mgnify:CR=1 FL=1
MDQKIYKILRESEWENALEADVLTGSPIDIKDGFIHFSTSSQVKETAKKHFSREDNLFLLEIDINDLSNDLLKWETSRNGQLFPHLYSSLEIKVISQIWPLRPTDDGPHDFSVIE